MTRECKRFSDALASLMAGSADEQQRQFLEAHGRLCPECLEQYRRIQSALEMLGGAMELQTDCPDELKESLGETLGQARLRTAKTRTGHQGVFGLRRMAWGLAAAAALLLAIVFGWPLWDRTEAMPSPDAGDSRELLSSFEITEIESVPLDVEFIAGRALSEVSFAIDLGDGVSFDSPREDVRAKKSHQWTGRLEKGANSIPFVVTAGVKGRHVIRISAEFEGFRHIHEIELDVSQSRIVVRKFRLPKERLG